MQHVKILIIGSGFAGLGAAIRLTQEGERDFVVIERGSDVGGAWRDNTYPGAECDVPSHLYSFSFDPNPNWSRSFSPQGEIQAYLHDSARRHDMLPKIRLNTTVTGASWDSAAGRWIVETSAGSFSCTFLINGSGALSEPSLPEIDGIDSFQGDFFHSAQWNHRVSLEGKRVAVIGTGASAIQIVPEVVKQAAHVDVYQRTAPWVVPRIERSYRAPERWLYRRLPFLQRASRAGIYAERELLVFGMARNPRLMNLPRRYALTHLARQVRDPELRRRLTPDWQIGCKRILISNKWYPALQRPHVELVTDAISSVRPDGIVTRDGRLREVDAIVLATGFHVTDPPIAEVIKGADGATLGEVWRAGGQQGYKGTTVAGFPNLFLLIGPNTGLGHTSMVYMIESQLNYILSALQTLRTERLTRFEVRPARQSEYNRSLQNKMRGTVWSIGGCASWYLDAHGNNTTLWPDFTFRFRRITRHFDQQAYDCS